MHENHQIIRSIDLDHLRFTRGPKESLLKRFTLQCIWLLLCLCESKWYEHDDKLDEEQLDWVKWIAHWKTKRTSEVNEIIYDDKAFKGKAIQGKAVRYLVELF